MSGFDNYKLELQKVMEKVCAEHRLFPNSLQFNKSTSKKMSGYKIQIFEEDYPANSATHKFVPFDFFEVLNKRIPKEFTIRQIIKIY